MTNTPKPKSLPRLFRAAAMSSIFLVGCETSQHDLALQAKIGREEAQKIALTKAPDGTVKEGELEKEHGKLIWSFDIARPGTKDITEVQVDAKTGAVVNVENETPAQQDKEAKEKK